MGRKKGKGKSNDEKWDEGDEGATAGLGDMSATETGGDNPIISSRGAGKKGKAKKKNFDDLDAEVDAIAAEMGMDEKRSGGDTEPSEESKASGEAELGDKETKSEESTAAAKDGGMDSNSGGTNKTPATGGGKKSKKKKKKGDIDDEELESMLREIEGGGSMDNAMQEKGTPVLATQESVSKEAGETTASGGGEGEGEEGGEATVMTPAQKKAAKKEREKKKKEAARQARLAQQSKQEGTTNSKEDGATTDEKKATTTVERDVVDDKVDSKEQVKSKVGDVKVEGEDELGEKGEEAGGEGDDDGQTEDKKKKKKKKKKEEEKPKGKTPGKAAISKIKKLKAALEEEQRRREEEALAAQKEEEERERKRLEQLRLEQERKERLKQREKERKARRKLEGKPVTKKEKEAEQRRLAHLEALRQQGISVPEKRQGMVDEQGKKKVKYVARQRKNKKKPETGDEDSTTAPSAEAVETTKRPEDDQEEDVPDRWDEDSVKGEEEGVEPGEEGGHVKANWDDESDEEEESTTDHSTKPAKPDKPAEAGAASENDSEEEGSSSSESEEEDSESEEELTPLEKVKRRIEKRRERYEAERSEDTLRSPVVCVLGHVDTGKTKILDKIRRTNVQDGEAGGITQQIGATFVPQDAIREQTKMVKEFAKTDIKVPGLLIIDTPGHESFSNLRSRGSSMCDIAILVVDIMHGLEPQTLESLNILRKGKTPFIVALNKIDRMYDWQRNPSGSVRDTLKRQKTNTKDEFDERTKQTIAEFAEQGLNAAMFWEKVDFKEYIPMVPTSAITGDGMGDLIALLVTFSIKMLTKQLMLSMELEALVLEVKVIAGLGTTIDVILRNGVLREGDTLVLTGTEGPFATTVRALLMPQPLRELRVKNAYVQHKAVLAAQGVKVTSKGELEKTLAGTSVLVAKKADEIEVLKAEAAEIMKSALSSIKLQERGVYVQASTLGSLEALLEFLKQSKIPYCGVSIGPVHKKDVMKASVMLEHDSQWAVILAFDVRVERDAQEMADSLGVKVFSADIIYHLFDAFLKHRQELLERKRREFEHIAVFPCKLRIMPNCIFNTRDPIVVGVVVEAGIIKSGTPLTVPSKSFTDIGVVSSIEVNHKQVDMAHKGEEVCIKVEATGGDAPRLYGRHFDHTDLLVSKISRESIDAVKNYFREDLQKSDWQLIIELKKTFQII